MADHLTPEQRHLLMSKIRGENTSTELRVRKIVHSLGLRYRLHVRNLPGTPDLVFPGKKKVIFVHGCFWHGHECKHLPKSNKEYWRLKWKQNRLRDKNNIEALEKLGWGVFVLWECWTRNPNLIIEKVSTFFDSHPV